jgi:hypothetical protein
MDVQTDIVSLKVKSDATEDFLAQVKSKDSCAGTFHKVGEYELPCIGGGLLCRSYEQRRYTATHAEHKEAIGIFQSMTELKAEQLEFGDVNPNAKVETVVCQPRGVMSCPCSAMARYNDYDKNLLAELGIETMPKLRAAQMHGLEAFKQKKMSLFIHGESGGGKTVLAAACAIGFHRKVKVLIGDEISAEWRRKAFDNQALDYDGLLILDDVDKTMPTDSFKEKLWYIFDRVAKRKLRMVITTNLSPEAFAEKYTSGKDEAQSMVTRLSKFEAVEL